MGLYPEEGTTGFASEAVTVDNTAGGVGLTSATYSPSSGVGASRALLTLEDAPCRYRYDGVAPTATVGHVLQAGEKIVLEGPANIYQFRAIRSGGVSGTLFVTYER